jgi:hypothetical protein
VNTKYKKGQFYTLLKATNAINHTWIQQLRQEKRL